MIQYNRTQGAYFKAWREANKEKTAEHRRRYWEKRALARVNALKEKVNSNGTI
jgi:hypothetical protein